MDLGRDSISLELGRKHRFVLSKSGNVFWAMIFAETENFLRAIYFALYKCTYYYYYYYLTFFNLPRPAATATAATAATA